MVVQAEPLQGVRVEYFAVREDLPLCAGDEAEEAETLTVATVESAVDRPYQNA